MADTQGGGGRMALIERCVGLDACKQTVAACVRVPGSVRGREQHLRRFGTTAADLLALRDWLEGYHVTHVAMESRVWLEAGTSHP